jgi:hypothetical protein
MCKSRPPTAQTMAFHTACPSRGLAFDLGAYPPMARAKTCKLGLSLTTPLLT